MPSDRAGAVILDLLEHQAAFLLEECRWLLRLVEQRPIPGETPISDVRIWEMERTHGSTARELRNRICATSVTPVDADDLCALAERLAQVHGGIHAALRDLTTCGIAPPASGAVGLARLLARESQELAESVALLRGPGNRERILDRCDRIDRMDEDAERMVDESLEALFEAQRRPAVNVIGWKDVLERIGAAAGCCRDAAHVVRRILARNAWGRAAPLRS